MKPARQVSDTDGAGALGLAQWTLALAAATVVVWAAGRTNLAGPSLGAPGTWRTWVATTDPVVTALALARLAALAVAAYAWVLTIAGLGLRMVHAQGLVRNLDRLTPAVIRRCLSAALSATVATATFTVSGSAPALAQVPPATATSVPTDMVRPVPRVTMHRLAPDTAPESATPESAGPDSTVADEPAEPGRRWTVAPGQSFWSIAEHVVGAARPDPPSEGEVAVYWLRVIAANRHELAHRANPDLIFPGQVFVLPPLG